MFFQSPSRSASQRFAELSPRDAASRAGAIRLIDVRSADEFHGDLGHVHGAELVPLDKLVGAISKWERNRPVLMICRSGRRSSRAAELLVGAGFSQVYNLTGGMMAWNQDGLSGCDRQHGNVAGEHRCEPHPADSHQGSLSC